MLTAATIFFIAIFLGIGFLALMMFVYLKKRRK